jgi:hypothetical protein
MIDITQARALLTELSPALAEADRQHAAEEPDELLPTILMARFADVLAHAWNATPVLTRQHIFDTIERFMVEGDERLQNAVATGFLEALLNHMLEVNIDRPMVEAMLGPESISYLKEWDRFSDNPYRYRFEKLKEEGILRSEQAEKYVQYLEGWLTKHWYPSAERTEVENVLRELRSAMKGHETGEKNTR